MAVQCWNEAKPHLFGSSIRIYPSRHNSCTAISLHDARPLEYLAIYVYHETFPWTSHHDPFHSVA